MMPTSPSDRLRIGYVLKQFPRLSETFVLNEVLGVERHGVEVHVHSLRQPLEGRFHPALADLQAAVRYLETNVDRASFLATMQTMPDVDPVDLRRVLDFLDHIPSERRSRLLLQGLELADAVRRDGLRHLHSHFLTIAAQTCHIAHLLTGVSWSVTAHAKDVYRTSINWDLANELAGSAARVVTVCDANQRHLEAMLPAARIERIYNGVGPQLDAAGPDEREPGLLLGVGRLVPKKGFDLLVSALAGLRSDGAAVRCVLVGDGECRADLEAQALALGVSDAVEFVGAQTQEHVAGWMRRASVLVAPCVVGPDGNQDALPTVMVEALAAGLPIVSTHIAGIPEIVEHGRHGLLVAPEPQAIAGAISDVLDDEALRSSMVVAGPQRQRERFDRVATTGELVELFRQIAVEPALSA